MLIMGLSWEELNDGWNILPANDFQ